MIRYLLIKYLRPGESFGFITLTKWLAFLGIALGVAVLLVSMAVMNGMNKSFMDRLLTMNYPITLFPQQYKPNLAALEDLKDSYKFSPFLQSQVGIKNGTSLDGAMLFGVDFEKEIEINPILRDTLTSIAAKKHTTIKEIAKELNSGFYLIAGQRLASKLEARSGDKLALIFSKLAPAGLSTAPIFKRFMLIDTFRSGLGAYDSTYAYTSLSALSKVLKNQAITGIHVHAKEPEKAAAKLSTQLAGSFSVVGWWEQNGNILAAMQLEKRALFIILLMLVLIAALNIITSLLMIVLNRRKEIALLLALGASAAEIRAAFFTVGFAIGAAGTLAGSILGAIAMFALSQFDLISLPADVYGSAKLPLDLATSDAVLIILGSLIISALAALYPAHKAAKTDALTTLRED